MPGVRNISVQMDFVLGISETWSKDLVKKKQERLDKLEETNKKVDNVNVNVTLMSKDVKFIYDKFDERISRD